MSSATAWAEPAEGRCHKHWDQHSHKWKTRCEHAAPGAAAPSEAAAAPSAGPSGGAPRNLPNDEPTDRYWYDESD
jgi:hypothetical protein